MRNTRRDLMARAALLLLLIGCTDTSAPTGLPETTTSATSALPRDLAAVQATLTRYFDAVKSGDFGAAMKERCSAARIPDDERELFLSQTKDLLAMGSMTAVEVSDKLGPHVLPAEAPSDPIPFDYAIVSGPTRSDLLHGVAITQDGAVRLCGYAQTDVDRITVELKRPVPSGSDPTRALSELIPTTGPNGYDQFEDRAVSKSATSPAGWRASWTRVWRLPTYGGVRVTATRFDSAAAASADLSASLAKIASDATETFAIPGVANAIGVRYSAVAWTWLQPPFVGYQIDRVLMLFGNTLIAIDSSGLTPEQPHGVATGLALAIDKSS